MMPPAADALPASARLVHPSGRWALVVRLLLTAVVAASTVAAALAPVERSVDELLTALARGEVRTLTIDRPTGEAVGSFPVLVAPARRLTGGWAFLISLFAGPALLSAVTGS